MRGESESRPSAEQNFSKPMTVARERAAVLGVKPLHLAFGALGVGLAALPLLVAHWYWAAGGLILLSRAASTMLPANLNKRDAALAACLNLIFLGAIPFGFALANPQEALAASLLLFGIIAVMASSLFAEVTRNIRLADTAICAAGYVVACAVPEWFGPVAYILSLAAFAASGVRVASALSRSNA
jgi:hypothetical protein